jgi:hypothetical protein
MSTSSQSNQRYLDHIKFDEIFLDEILSGRKTTTIRFGRTRYRKGDKVFLMSGNYVYGILEITDLVSKQLAELNDKDALLDGFKNRDELLRFLFYLYPNLDLDTPVNIIKFRLVKRYSEPIPLNIARFYREKDPKELALEIISKLSDQLREYDRKILRDIASRGLSFAKRKYSTDYYTLHRIIKRYAQRIGYNSLVRKNDKDNV